MKSANVEIVETKVVIIGNVEKTISPEMTHKMYGWSKYSGAKFGLVQENKTLEWCCQACGETQASDLPSYMFEFIENEFIRICSICQARKIVEGIKTFEDLVQLVRKKDLFG